MSTIDHEMQRLARIVATDRNLQVEVRGMLALASPGKVILPNIDTLSWLGTGARRMLHGLLDHECGHALDSDFDALGEWRTNEKPDEALNDLQMAVEDGYVDRCQGIRYLGTRTNIRLMNEWFTMRPDEEGRTHPARIKEPEDGDRFISDLIIALGALMTPHGGSTFEYYEKLNPEVGAFLRTCEPEIEEARSIKGSQQTKRNIDIAKRLYEKLKLFGNTEDYQGFMSRMKGGFALVAGNGQPGQEGEPQDQPMEGSGNVSKTQDRLVPEFVLERWKRESGGSTNASDAINAEIKRKFSLDGEASPYLVFSTDYDVVRDFTQDDPAKWSADYQREFTESREMADALVSAFEHALLTSAMVTPISGADEGEVDPEALIDFAVGTLPADQLYIDYGDGDDLESAVFVLVDCSGSMHGRKAQLAQRTAIAMNRGLELLSIPHEIGGFTTLESDNRYGRHGDWIDGRHQTEIDANFSRMRQALIEQHEAGVDVTRFARALSYGSDPYRDTLLVPHYALFKRFETKDCRPLTNIIGTVENLDGEAVMWAARRLAKRTERRKVLFVLSDGYPAGSRDNLQGHRYLEESVTRVISAGIEVYGIGIVSDAVKQFYPEWWRADTENDLVRVAMTSITAVLSRRRTERHRVVI